MTINLPDIGRSATQAVTLATQPVPSSDPVYDPAALLAEVVLRFEHAGLLPADRRVPDPQGAHDAAEALLKALGISPVDLGMGQRIARRVAALAGAR